MVWHQQNQVRPPFTSPVAKLDSVKQVVSNLTAAKVVVPSWVTANRNKVNSLVGPNP
jgi:hypothetical protein